MSLPLRLGLLGAALVVIFTAGTSFLLLIQTGQWATYDDVWWPFAWWYLAWWWPTSTPVLVSGGVPLAVVGVAAGKITYRQNQKVHGWPLRLARKEDVLPTIEAGTDNYGHAHFSTMEENRKRWPADSKKNYVGLVVGEASDPREDEGQFDPEDRSTWGRLDVPLLIDDLTRGSTHKITFAGSGALKTLSDVIPNLLTFRGPVVCTDPKQNLAERVREAREAMGHRVVVIGPGNPGFNTIAWIDPTSVMFGIDIDNVIEDVCGHTPKRDPKAAFFKDSGKDIARCLLADMLWDTSLPAAQRSLAALRRQIRVSSDQLAKTLKDIAATSAAPIARDKAASLASDLEKAPEMFAGYHRAVIRDTDWLGNPAYAQIVSGDAFRPTDILDGDVDVFIALPLKALSAQPAPARCIIGSLMNAVYDAKGNFPAGRVLFEIEEAAAIGRMNIFELARNTGRELGITMHLVYQSPGQMREDWGDAETEAWYGNASRNYAAIGTKKTADEVVGELGDYGIVNFSESQNVGSSRVRPMAQKSRSWGKNVTHSWGRRELKKAVELMYDMRLDAQIIIPQPGTGWPAIARRAFAPRRPDMLDRVKGLY